ncbi:MAG: hypothetical protein JNK79_14480 [Chitinophagaceae bacterium]|nr:hypothetical protein [Chitinophagaceae bacterium]
MEVKEQIPSQEHGAKSNVSYAVKGFAEKEGDEIYEKARKNLLDINRWHELSGALSARFYLTDPYGNETDRLPLQGDYIKIHLPSSADDKFDWVRIELIEERKPREHIKWIMIRVRPSDPPQEKQETEHFFSEEATSNFYVGQTGRKVEASVGGRNELPNIEAPGMINKIRDVIVGLAAMAGFNYPQWKSLVKGILSAGKK